MSYSYTITQTMTGGGSSVSGGARTFTGTGKLGISESIPNGATNTLVALALTRSLVKCIALKAVGGALTVKTNSSSSPVDNFTIANGQALFWGNDEDVSRMRFSADVTALYVSNASGATVTFTVEGLTDATP